MKPPSMSVVISGAIVLWLLASSLVLGLADDQVSSEVLDYASHRKGEFLSAQYQRALEMEASALKLAAERKFQEAEELLSLCVRIHEQLLGPRHPQLIKALLANAENSAMWGDSIGMEGKQHVEHAKELVDRALLILSSTPLPTRDTMGEEELHLLDMKQVIEQMLAAMSPPEVLTSIRGTQQLPTLPGVKVLSPGELTFGSLNRFEFIWICSQYETALTVRDCWYFTRSLLLNCNAGDLVGRTIPCPLLRAGSTHTQRLDWTIR